MNLWPHIAWGYTCHLKLDRLSRITFPPFKLVNELKKRYLFVSLMDKIDTTTPQGNFIYDFWQVAEFRT